MHLEANAPWFHGGGGNLFPGLSWQNRPDMAGSEAPEALQDAWVATMLAIRLMVGRIPGTYREHCGRSPI